MMDLYHSHRLDFGKLFLVGFSNWLVRHFERALSLAKEKQQPLRSVILSGPRFELLAVLMIVLSRSLLCRNHRYSLRLSEAVPVVEVKEQQLNSEQQLSSEQMYRPMTQTD